MFYILLLFLMCHKLYCGWLPSDPQYLSFLVLISIPYYLPISISLSIMPCNTLSSSASSTSSSAYFTVRNYLSSYFEASKPFKNFVGRVFAVLVECSRWRTSSLSNFSSSLHTYCLPWASRTLTLWSMYITWVSNLFMTGDHTSYCGLVRGPHVGK
jgi:hypothetical protein